MKPKDANVPEAVTRAVFQNVELNIERGNDGLYGLRALDLTTGAVWWVTICETEAQAQAALKSHLETEAMKALQNQLKHVSLNPS